MHSHLSRLCAVCVVFWLTVAYHVALGAVGRIDREVNVKQGIFSYSIPVQVPFGVLSVKPSLSIEYSSHAKVGLFGKNWDLGGISVISRCYASLGINGFKGGIYLNEDDVFCMDGQKLLNVGGNSYKNAKENWFKITAVSATNLKKDITGFQVITREGSTRNYTGISSNGKAPYLTWSISEEADLHGNTVSYSYNTAGYLQSISYGGNSKLGLAHSRSVQFSYRPRKISIVTYTAGISQVDDQLITAITMNVNGEVATQFLIDYQASASDDMIATIRKCGADMDCFTTKLQWSYYGLRVPATGNWNTQYQSIQLKDPLQFEQVSDMFQTDVNGDGLFDLTFLSVGSQKNVLSKIYTAPYTQAPATSDLTALTGNRFKYNDRSQFFSIDVDGDGKMELLQLWQDTTTSSLFIFCYRGANGAFSSFVQTTISSKSFDTKVVALPSDVNGDGKTDLIIIYKSEALVLLASDNAQFVQKSSFYLPFDYSTSPGSAQVGDINGDGLTDLIFINYKDSSGGTNLLFYVLLADPKKPGFFLKGSTFNTGYSRSSVVQQEVLDLNGDGSSDILIISKESSSYVIRTFYSAGDGVKFIQTSSSDIKFNPSGNTIDSISTTDLNADGYDDLTILVEGDTTTKSYNSYVYFGSAQGISRNYNYTKIPNSMSGLNLFADYIGNARSQLVVLNENNYLYLFDSAFYPPLFVSGIDEGYNSFLSVEQQYITNDSAGVYKGLIPTTMPLKRQRIALGVVSSYTMTDNLSGVKKRLSYTYEDIATDVNTGLFVGFLKVVVRDVDGTLQVTEYSQTYPLAGVETSSSRYCDQQTTTDARCASATAPILLARTENNMETIYNSNTRVWEVRHASTNESRYEYGTLYSTTVTQFKYADPSYGCIIQKTVTDTNQNQDPIVILFKFDFLNDVQRNAFGYVTNSKTLDISGTPLRLATQGYDTNTFDIISIKEWNNDTNTWPAVARTFDAVGNLLTSTDTNGATTSFTYDYTKSLFFLSKIAPPNAAGVQLFWNYTYYDKFNQMKSETDRNGVTITTQVDSLGRVIAHLGPDDSSSTGQQVVLSRVSYITDQTNNIITKEEVRKDWGDSTQWITTSSYFDAFSRQIMSVSDGANDGSSVIQQNEYDITDNLVKKWVPYFANNPQNLYAQMQYDVYGRMVKTVEADQVVTEVSYDPRGLRKNATEAAGTNVQDSTLFDFKFMQGKPQVTDVTYSTGVKLSFGYSVLGEQTSATVVFTNGSKIVVKGTQFNSFGQPSIEFALNTALKKYVYDGTTGLISEVQLNGITSTTFAYDLSKRVVKMTLIEPKQGSRKREVEFDYEDANIFPLSSSKLYGRLSQVSETIVEDSGSTSKIGQAFAYDSYGRIVQHKVNIDGLTYTYVDSFTPAQIATSAYPDGKTTLQRSYTRNGVLSEFQMNGKSVMKYSNFNPSSDPQSIAYGNGYTSTVNYDVVTGLKNEISYVSATGETKFYNKVDYNARRFVVDIADKSGKILEQFKYSKIGELINASGPYGTEQFEYDQLGNLVEKDGITFEYSGFRVVKGSDRNGNVVFSAAYDDFGNMIQKTDSQGNWVYTYNEQLRLATVAKNGQVVVSYEYDFTGHRVKRTTPTSTIVYPAEDYEVNLQTNEISRYVLQGPMNSARVELTNTTTVYYYANHIENNVLVTSDDGQEIHLSYKPFGEDVDTSASAKFKFSGRYWDTEARLYYFRERFYDPAIGRFISADSVLGGGEDIVTSYNRYAFVLNNPANYFDPNGQSIWEAIAGAVIGVLEVVAGVALDIVSGGSLAIVGNGLIGAGTSGILYSAMNYNDFSWKQYAIDEAIGGVTDMALGVAGMALARTMSAERAAVKEATQMEVSATRKAAMQEERSATDMFSGCSFCLTGETKVLLHDLSTKAVQDIVVGDVVAAMNGSVPIVAPVVGKVERITTTQLRLYYTSDSEIEGTITVTPNHRIFVEKKGYIPASDIEAGDRFVSLKHDNTLVIKTVTSEELTNPVTVYNLEVDKVHNYFITDHYILVHNVKSCKVPLQKTKEIRMPGRQKSFAKRFGKGLKNHDADHTVSLTVFKSAANKSGGLTKAQTQVLKDLANSDTNFAMVPSSINRGPNNVADNKIVALINGSKKSSTVADAFLAKRARNMSKVIKTISKRKGAPKAVFTHIMKTLKRLRTKAGAVVVKAVKPENAPELAQKDRDIPQLQEINIVG